MFCFGFSPAHSRTRTTTSTRTTRPPKPWRRWTRLRPRQILLQLQNAFARSKPSVAAEPLRENRKGTAALPYHATTPSESMLQGFFSKGVDAGGCNGRRRLSVQNHGTGLPAGIRNGGVCLIKLRRRQYPLCSAQLSTINNQPERQAYAQQSVIIHRRRTCRRGPFLPA